MPPRIAPAFPIAPATFANDPGRCGIRTLSVMLYDADGWRARSFCVWSTWALSPRRWVGRIGRKHPTPTRHEACGRGVADNARVHRLSDRVAGAVLPLTLVAAAAAVV